MNERTNRVVAFLACAAAALAAPACGGGTEGGDRDADADAAPPDRAEARPEAECRLDYDCSNGVFCDGVEKCVDGACVAGEPPGCDDALGCTADTCDETLNACRHDYSDALCDDGNVCNGVERCLPASPFSDPSSGCIMGTPVVCDDGNDCTEDACDPADGACTASLRDQDDDGFGDRTCTITDAEGNKVKGTDCDDTDPAVHPDAAETCGDGIDNNCDRMADLYDDTCLPANDTCDTPTALPAGGGSIIGSTRGTADTYKGSCADAGAIDVVFRLDLAADHDVGLNVFGDFDAAVSVRTACAEASAELYCGEGSVWARGLEAGAYYVIVEGARAGNFTISVELAPYTNVYTVPPTNDTCAAPYVVPAEGGLFVGTTAGMANDFTATCGSTSRSPDAVFELTLAARKKITARTATATYDGTLHMHAAPCAGGTELSCNDDASDTRHSEFTRTVDAGTYYIVVDGYGTSNSGAYELNIVVTDPP